MHLVAPGTSNSRAPLRGEVLGTNLATFSELLPGAAAAAAAGALPWRGAAEQVSHHGRLSTRRGSTSCDLGRILCGEQWIVPWLLDAATNWSGLKLIE